ncbi:MAG: MBL fold metallo-hydrolase [Candidatus Dormibacteria bacterium]
MTPSRRWQAVTDGILRWVGNPVDVNCILVRGDRLALLVDTGSTQEEGRELRRAVEVELGRRELAVVNTHAHYDHCFGNSAFSESTIYASEGCLTTLQRSGTSQRREAAESFREGDPEFAARLGAAPIVLPNRPVDQEARLDLGGIEAHLRVMGRGHTDHDLVVVLPDLGAVLAGDLVEESGPPALEDSYPLSWPRVLGRILALTPKLVVPGHGRVVGPEFVAGQRAQLAELARWCLGELGMGPRVPEHRVPFPPASLGTALDRARLELSLGPSAGARAPEDPLP